MVQKNNRKTIQGEDYVDKAERLMKELSKVITTSKIRDLLAQVNELYNDIILQPDEKLSKEHVEAIRHLKVKMIYDAGRDRQERLSGQDRNDRRFREGKLTYFFNQTGLLEMVSNIGDSRKRFLDYCKYFEALVAYHKYYGGRE
ncbi:MAG TPA: type III-A CRISPR-associated protein Csm2 [Eubacteriaceae bacterium]|nr:type III-A CRISPR-associated protein Csm2 [Eubacteriaceae bacterium]